MSFNVRFTINNDNPVQPTGIADWIALGYISIVSFAMVFSIIVMLLRGRKYAPLRVKDVPKMIVMAIFGLIHIWFAFMTNEHFPLLNQLQRMECSVFSFWLQYLLGLNMWFVVLILRLETYIWIFSERIRDVTKNQFRATKFMTSIVLTIPLATLFIVLSSTNGSTWDEESSRCTTALPYKLILLGWIIFEMILLITFFFTLKGILTANYYKEYESLGNIILLGITIIIINGFIVFFGGLSYSIGRSVATILIGTLHIFSLLRIAGLNIWRAATCDKKHARAFLENQQHALVGVKHVEEIKDDDEIINDFLNYCRGQKGVSFKRQDEDVTIKVEPTILSECREEMIAWKMGMENGRLIEMASLEIIRKFIANPQSKKYIFPPTKIVRDLSEDEFVSKELKMNINPVDLARRRSTSNLNEIEPLEARPESDARPPTTLFDPLIDWIVKRLDEFWGQGYLERAIFKRPIWSLLIQRKLLDTGSLRISNRQEEEKLLDHWGMVSQYEMGTSNPNDFNMKEFSNTKSVFEIGEFGNE